MRSAEQAPCIGKVEVLTIRLPGKSCASLPFLILCTVLEMSSHKACFLPSFLPSLSPLANIYWMAHKLRTVLSSKSIGWTGQDPVLMELTFSGTIKYQWEENKEDKLRCVKFYKTAQTVTSTGYTELDDVFLRFMSFPDLGINFSQIRPLKA